MESNQEVWKTLPDHSRIWIYQSSKELNAADEQVCEEMLTQFMANWNSHGQELQASWALFDKRFLVLFVNESIEAPSGCSIDSSVRVVQSLGEQLSVDFFGRLSALIIKDGRMEELLIRELWARMKAGVLNLEEVCVYDNLIKTKGELLQKWVKPLSESWHAEAFMR